MKSCVSYWPCLKFCHNRINLVLFCWAQLYSWSHVPLITYIFFLPYWPHLTLNKRMWQVEYLSVAAAPLCVAPATFTTLTQPSVVASCVGTDSYNLLIFYFLKTKLVEYVFPADSIRWFWHLPLTHPFYYKYDFMK